MEKTFNLKIVTPEKVYEDTLVDKIIVLTSDGEVSILPHHIEYLANVEISVLTITKDGKDKHYAVGGGAIHFIESTNTAFLVLNGIIAVENIDIDKTRKLQEEAQKKLQTDLSRLEHKEQERELRKAMIELMAKNTYKE